MLRNFSSGLAAASLTLGLVALGGSTTGRAQGWSYHAVDRALGQLKRYVDHQITKIRYNDIEPDDDYGILLMKLGMGIPYCKGHAAGIAVRDGKLFRKVAMARTLRGVTSRTIGLTAARLAPGTYYIVHGYCHVGRRAYNVGQRSRDGGRRMARSDEPRRLFKRAYAKFTIEKGQVLNAGFLRFFPPKRGGRRITIKLQSVPRADLRFIAARYPELEERLVSRLMLRTTAAGHVLGGPRARRAATAAARNKRRKQRQAAVPPRPRPPAANTAARASRSTGSLKRSHSSSMTPDQRRAACVALLQLKKEGKVRNVPQSCGQYKEPVAKRSASGLPPAIGPDK